MSKNILDYYIASKLIKAQATPPVDLGGVDDVQPYSYELNKKLPSTITRDDLIPENIAKFPELPPEVKPLAEEFVAKLEQLDAIVKGIKQKEAEFTASMKAQVQEKNELKIELNKRAQELGPLVQKIEPKIDTVISIVRDKFIAAQEIEHTKVEVTMDSSAQLEMLKGMMMQVNADLGTQVIAKFEEALQAFTVTNTAIERTLRVWPIPQKKMKGKAIKLIAQVQESILQLIMKIRDFIMAGLTGLTNIQASISNESPMAAAATVTADVVNETRSKQTWQVGDTVNVGFTKGLVVQQVVLTPGDYKPDYYILKSPKGVMYKFTPHNGLEKLGQYNSVEETEGEMVSKKQVLKELEKHQTDVNEFYAKFGDKPEYHAYDVLVWLGY